MEDCHFCNTKLKVNVVIFCQNRHEHYCHLRCGKIILKSLFDQFLNPDISKLKCQEPDCNAFYVGISRENSFTSYDSGIKSAKQVIGIDFNRRLQWGNFDANTKIEKIEIKNNLYQNLFK